MKKSLLFAVTLMLLVACSDNGKNTNDVLVDEMSDFVGMELVDIREEGGEFPIKMWLPKEDKTGPRKIIFNADFGRCEITAGKGFQVNIYEAGEGEENVEVFKTDPGLDIYTEMNFIIENDSTILFKGSNDHIERDIYMFYAIVHAGNDTYIVENRELIYFTQKECEKMINSAQDIRKL